MLKNFNANYLERLINRAVEIGYDTFLVGMAVGFDTIVFNLLEKVRAKTGIKIIACVPCNNQDLKFKQAQKKEYKRIDKNISGVEKLSVTDLSERCK